MVLFDRFWPPYACQSALRASLLGACTLGASESRPKRITRLRGRFLSITAKATG